jgi:hypothetical protein
MTLNRFVLTTAFIAAATLATTVSAQERDSKKREATRSEQGAKAKGEAQGRQSDNSRRAEPRRDDASRAADARREESARVAESQRREAEAARAAERRNDAIRQEKRDGNYGRDYGRAESRRDAESIRNEKYKDAARREFRRDQLGRYYYNPSHVYVAPRVYARPYAFRPSFSIGFGIYAGYPVPYSYRYSAPIVVYGYRAPRVPVYVSPGSPLYGGIALEIGPYDADVFVDGSYAGHVEDFDGSVQPLTLVAGTHRIEVQAPGYAPLVFDVTIQPGQVIPYRGDLRPF